MANSSGVSLVVCEAKDAWKPKRMTMKVVTDWRKKSSESAAVKPQINMKQIVTPDNI